MARSRELKGQPASPGIAVGPLLRLRTASGERKPTGDPQADRSALEQAIAAAVRELEALQTGQDAREGGGMLDFQIAMLEDESLRAPAFTAIAQGTAAGVAWSAALANEIGQYETAADEHFRARASDLRDLRDRVLLCLSSRRRERLRPAGAVLFAEDMPPSLFLETDWSGGGGLALAGGSPSSHLAILARARGIPRVVGLDGAVIDGHREILIDGGSGLAILSPGAADRRKAEMQRREDAARASRDAALLDAPAISADGTRVAVMLNIADPEELATLDPLHCDGIGLVRTEFLCRSREAIFDEASQFAAYRRIVTWAAGRPVTFRTLDAGGDKPIVGYTSEAESNPFLGMRGIRLSLQYPDALLTQLRALVRAAALGPVKIMLPMVTVPKELAEASRLLDCAVAAVGASGATAPRPPLGIMVEVPAAALDIARFPANFFSIGSNDLTQYVTAASRDSAPLAVLNDVRNPAVLRLIAEVARHGTASGVEVSLCGDAGGDPGVIPHLLRVGLRCLSVAPSALARTKAAIAATDIGNTDG